MSTRKLVTWQQTGSAAGGAQRYLRATDWYNTSETSINVIGEPETHICYISTRDDMRDLVFINPFPDPDAVFSKKLTGPLLGPSSLGSGAAASADLYYSTATLMYLDKSELPLVVESFAADRKSAKCTSSIIGSYVDAGFTKPAPEGLSLHAKADDEEVRPTFTVPAVDRTGKAILGENGEQETMTVVVYPCTFKRVAMCPNCFGGRMGAIATYSAAGGRTRASGVFIYNFPKNYLGQYPQQTYLRMQICVKEGEREKWLDYIPPNPIQGTDTESATDEFGSVRYLIDDMELGVRYDAWVEDITAYPYDSSAVRERKQNLKTLVFDTAYFKRLRMSNLGNIAANSVEPNGLLLESSVPVVSDDKVEQEAQLRMIQSLYFWNANILNQPVHKTTFFTPVPFTDKRTPITFTAGSCFAGTLGAYKGAHLLQPMFSVLLGDKTYNDNSRGSVKDFYTNYMSWLFNEVGQRFLVSSGLLTVSDDHENSDNWDELIAISRFNVPRFFLDNGNYSGPENALMNKMLSIPSIAARILFRRTNQYMASLSPSERVKNSFEANNRFWPTMPQNIDAEDTSSNGCFMVRWGDMKVIVLNSNPDLNGDMSVTYHAVEGTLSADGSTFVRDEGEDAGYHYLPPESIRFLKRALLKAPEASCNAVFFSSDVACMFTNMYDAMKRDFIKNAAAAVRSDDPDAPLDYELYASTADKLFNSFNYASPDGYHEEIEQLVKWIKRKGVHNVFFFTGDPHSSLVRYLDKSNVIVSACLSAVSTYRASGANLSRASNDDSENTIISLSNNAFGFMKFDPVEALMRIELRYAEEVRAFADIPLNRRRNGWFY